jgi:hypothetical protein
VSPVSREDIPVSAKIHTIGGFSAHADRNELLAWWQATGDPDVTVLVHGDVAKPGSVPVGRPLVVGYLSCASGDCQLGGLRWWPASARRCK